MASVEHASLLFDLCDNLRTPFVPRIHLLEDHETSMDLEPNGDGLNGYLRMKVTDFVREYVGGSKPAILRIDEPTSSEGGANKASLVSSANAEANNDAALGVNDGDLTKFHWAVRWHSNEYLVRKVIAAQDGPEPLVTVALTPNGRADAITRIRHRNKADKSENTNCGDDIYFASAAEVKMPMSAFFEHLATAQHNDRHNEHQNNMTLNEEEQSMGPDARYHRFVDLESRCAAEDSNSKSQIPNYTNNVIPYIQLQNSSLAVEYGDTLHKDVPTYVKDMGRRLFGQAAEAENLWIGSGLSVTTMHQDWYENLYWVVRGTKTFTLVGPWEAPYLSKKKCKAASYMYERTEPQSKDESSTEPNCSWSYRLLPTLQIDDSNACEDDLGLVDWVSTDFVDDPAPIGARKGDTRHQCHPITASVHSGEVLYLPAMWFHAVEQQEDDEDSIDENYEEEEEKEEDRGNEPRVALHSIPATQRGILTSKAAAAPCVIAVNYWFEMNCGGPLFWMQDMLKNMFPQQK